MLNVKGVAYIDDLGHLEVEDGKHIKPHFLYRSAHLCKINEKGIKKLEKHHISDVIDFRTDEEVLIKEENVGENIKYHHVALLDDVDNPAITKETRLPVLLARQAEEGGARGYMIRFYPVMLLSEKAKQGYRKFFDILLKAKEGVIFHCTQGKDRTGIALLLLLSALGANKKSIVKKYLSYNRINWFFNFYVGIGMTLVHGPKLNKSLKSLLLARKEYIEAAYETLEKKFKGVLNYLKDEIHLNDEEITTLKAKYVM